MDSSFYGRIQRYNPDELVGKKGLTIYRKMAVDEQIKSAVYTKMFAVLSSGWEIQASKLPEEEQEMAEETRGFVEWNFEEMEGHFDSKLQEMMTALIYGFAAGELVYHLIDYGQFSGKIGLKDLKFRRPESIDFECFSADTELLTKDGWKLVSVLSKVDDLATLNPATDELEYQKPTRLYRYPYRGQMLHQTGKHVDFLVTPNHRLWVKKSKDTPFQFVEAQSVVGGPQEKLSHQDIGDIKSARDGYPRNKRGELYRQLAGRYDVSAKHIESVANGRFAKSRRVYDRAVYHVKRDCLWIGEGRQFFILPAVTSERVFYTGTGRTETVHREYIKPEIQIPMDDWLRFFGIWLAEGCINKARKGANHKGDPTKPHAYTIQISQNVGPNFDAIKRWVEACGFNYSVRFSNPRHANVVIYDLRLHTYLEQFGKSHDKFIPQDLMGLSLRQLRILYDAMMMGDGDANGGYTSASKRLADNVAELLLKIGYAATVHTRKSTRYEKNYGLIYRVHRSEGALNDTACNIKANNAHWVDYDGDVFCLEVPNHIVYARHNGKACWSGNSDEHGNLLDDGVVQTGKKLPKSKFLIYTYRKQFSNPYGQSDLREAYRSHWLKDVVLKYMSIGLERYGEPVADISHEGAITQGQRADLENFAKNIQSRSALIHDSKITLDFKYPGWRSEPFTSAINLYDTHLRIAILMPGLMGMAAEQQVGSLARSGTEFNVFLWIINQLRLDVETAINEQVVKPLIDLNYEVTGGQYPKFKFREVDEEREARIYDMWLAGVSSGNLKKFPEDEAKFRATLGLAEKTEEELEPEEPELPFPPLGEEEDGEALFEAERALAKMSDEQVARISKSWSRLARRPKR